MRRYHRSDSFLIMHVFDCPQIYRSYTDIQNHLSKPTVVQHLSLNLLDVKQKDFEKEMLNKAGICLAVVHRHLKKECLLEACQFKRLNTVKIRTGISSALALRPLTMFGFSPPQHLFIHCKRQQKSRFCCHHEPVNENQTGTSAKSLISGFSSRVRLTNDYINLPAHPQLLEHEKLLSHYAVSEPNYSAASAEKIQRRGQSKQLSAGFQHRWLELTAGDPAHGKTRADLNVELAFHNLSLLFPH